MVNQVEKRYPQEIMATVCIPWSEQWTLEETLFRRQIRHLLSEGIRHIYLFGTAGEGYAVTDEQFEQIVAIFADEMKDPSLHPMVGLIHLSLPSILQRLRVAYKLGIREFQFSFPSWGALTDPEIHQFMHALCDPYPDCKFLLYHLGRAKRTLQVADFKRLAEMFPNFAGAKYSVSDITIIHSLIQMNSPLRFFITELGFAYANMIGGDCGLLISLGNTHIKRARQFYEAAISGDAKSTLSYQKELYGLLTSILETVGSQYIDGAYDKIFSKIIDPAFPLRLLPPYQSSTEAEYEAYREILEQKYPMWLQPRT